MPHFSDEQNLLAHFVLEWHTGHLAAICLSAPGTWRLAHGTSHMALGLRLHVPGERD